MSEHSNPTQEVVILAALRAGEKITPLDALDRFGCFRLASRISALKKAGHPIEKRMVKGGGGKKWAEYSLRTDTVSDMSAQ